MTFAGLNYLAVVLAAAASFIFGGLWYGVFSKAVDGGSQYLHRRHQGRKRLAPRSRPMSSPSSPSLSWRTSWRASSAISAPGR